MSILSTRVASNSMSSIDPSIERRAESLNSDVHDETCDVRATTARAFPLRFAITAEEAIASAKGAGILALNQGAAHDAAS